MKFTLFAGTYSTDDFNAKVQVAVLQQKEDKEVPQFKELLAIPEHYTFMVSNRFFIALGILGNYFEKILHNKSTLTPGSYKTPFDTYLPKDCYHYTINKSIELKTW